MKLRLETGNFKITGTATYDNESQTVTIDDLPKGLSAEDFIGCVAYMDANGEEGLSAITDAWKTSENVVAFVVMGSQMIYDRLTGKVTMDNGLPLPPDDPGNDPVNPGDGGEDTAE